ncbi:hypothetical protein DL95DRAFT_238642, partial [Leptodontidium sp. 2 PMI_412]
IDPFSALSVAACVVQFVDFASKIVSKGRQIYKTTDGVLRENAEAETVTIRLQELSKKVKDSIRAGNATELISVDSEEVQNQHIRLQEICKECTELGNLKVPKGSESRKWKSFRHALKSVWSKQALDSMAKRLETLRGELHTHILALVREKVSTLSIHQDNRFHKLDSNAQKIIQTLVETRDKHSEDLDKHFSALKEREKEEHAKTRAAFVRVDGDKRRNRVELDILESLRFSTIHDRYESLTKAHENTFLWIFQDPEKHQKPWDNFVKWLFSGKGTYWIQGKAASGKSTLMNFIWNRKLTIEMLKGWSVGSKLVVASFFFWNSGVQEQRSHIGLLRSLLFEALKDNKDLIPEIFPGEWDTKSSLASHDLPITPETWSLGRLKKAFHSLIRLATPELKLCFFIDGLDEYDGEPEDIAQYFKDLSLLSEHAKFCLSSRPWPVFQDIFRGTPGLRLQDLTYDDIKLYVSDKLEKNTYMQQLLLEDTKNTTCLIEEVTQKAAGVFLWVVLVIKSLINGLRNGDGIPHLRRRLASLPSDLENLYEHMLESIDLLYKEEASQIFQLFRASGHSLDVQTLERALFFSEYRWAIFMRTRVGEISGTEEEYAHMQLERAVIRLNSRSKGILEVQKNEDLIENLPHPSIFTNPTSFRISYLHRTVRDYLEKPLVWERLLRQTAHTRFDPNTALLMSYVIEVKSANLSGETCVYDEGVRMFLRTSSLELSACQAHVDLFEELDHALSIHWASQSPDDIPGHWSNGNTEWDHTLLDGRREWNGDVLTMAVSLNLMWYVEAKLESQDSLAGNKRGGLPLLGYALCFDAWSLSLKTEAKIPNYGMVELLLKHEANPNELYQGYTIWQYMIHYLYTIKVRRRG